MVASLTRRRVIQSAAAFGATSALPLATHAQAPSITMPIVRWQGAALGAQAQLTLAHPDTQQAEAVIKHCVKEIDRLESIFSLYREGSSISRLNKHYKLDNAPSELIEVIATAIQYGEQSEGVFDISIQPLWELYHQHFQQVAADPKGPSEVDVKHALEKVNFRNIRLDNNAITLQPNMALTLNGIAQGYITDQISTLLENYGFKNALVNLGEYRAIGQHPTARNWKLGIPSTSQPWKVAEKLEIPAGKALATSAADGTRWSRQAHHLLSPKTGHSTQTDHTSVSVIANTAMQADALATIFSLQSQEKSQRMIEHHHPAVSTVFLAPV